jgi:hypothetical protein
MWFTETPWPPIVICTCFGVLSFAAWYAHKRAVYLALTLLIAFAAAGVFLVERYVVTEAERVENAVYGLTSAFQRRDLEGTLEFISRNAPDMRTLAERGLQLVTVEDDLRITDVQIGMLDNDTRAISRFRANATVRLGGMNSGSRQPSRWLLTWQLEEGVWKVIRIESLDPLSGDQRPIPLP